jgi:hypothetical protein
VWWWTLLFNPYLILFDVNVSWNSVIESSSSLASPALRFVLVLYAASCSCFQNPQVPGVWGSKLSSDAQNGAFSQCPSSVGYICDPDRYLASRLNQHRGCVQFSVIGLWTWFHEGVYHLQGTIWPCSHNSHQGGIVLLLESVRRVVVLRHAMTIPLLGPIVAYGASDSLPFCKLAGHQP